MIKIIFYLTLCCLYHLKQAESTANLEFISTKASENDGKTVRAAICFNKQSRVDALGNLLWKDLLGIETDSIPVKKYFEYVNAFAKNGVVNGDGDSGTDRKKGRNKRKREGLAAETKVLIAETLLPLFTVPPNEGLRKQYLHVTKEQFTQKVAGLEITMGSGLDRLQRARKIMKFTKHAMADAKVCLPPPKELKKAGNCEDINQLIANGDIEDDNTFWKSTNPRKLAPITKVGISTSIGFGLGMIIAGILLSFTGAGALVGVPVALGGLAIIVIPTILGYMAVRKGKKKMLAGF